MTISTTTNKVQYVGDGATTIFLYDFLVPVVSDMVVTIDGVIISTGYTVNGAGDPLGGDVTFDVAPPAPVPDVSDAIIVLVRSVPQTQEMDLRPYDAFPADSVEEAFDKLTLLVQDLQEQVGRGVGGSITLPEGVNLIWPPYQAGYGFQWQTGEIQLELTDRPITDIVTDAETARDAASASASAALGSETNAAASETRADEWANNPEDIPVTTSPDKFSAFHWAQKAQDAAIGILTASQINYVDTITQWSVTECQSAFEYIDANFALIGASYLISETYSNTEVYAKAETYTQTEVDNLITASEAVSLDSAVAMAIALG